MVQCQKEFLPFSAQCHYSLWLNSLHHKKSQKIIHAKRQSHKAREKQKQVQQS